MKLTPADIRTAITHLRFSIEQLKSAGDAVTDGNRILAAQRLDKARQSLTDLRTALTTNPNTPAEPITLGGS
jgi:hypothetical protein